MTEPLLAAKRIEQQPLDRTGASEVVVCTIKLGDLQIFPPLLVSVAFLLDREQASTMMMQRQSLLPEF